MSALAAIPAVGDAAAAAKMAKQAATVGDVVRAVDKVDDVAGGVRTALKAADAASDAKAASAPIAKAIDATTQARSNVDKVIPRRVQNVLAKRQDEIQAGAEFTSNTVSDVQQALEENGGELRPGQLGEILSGNVKSAAVGYAADKVIGNAVENVAGGVVDRVKRRRGGGVDAPDAPRSAAPARTQVEADSTSATRQSDTSSPRALPSEGQGLPAKPVRSQQAADAPSSTTPRTDSPITTATPSRRSNNADAPPATTHNRAPVEPTSDAGSSSPRDYQESKPINTDNGSAASSDTHTSKSANGTGDSSNVSSDEIAQKHPDSNRQNSREQSTQAAKPTTNGRTTHHDAPQIEPGIVAKVPASGPGNHHVKVTTDGRVVRCSTCGELGSVYAPELAGNRAFKDDLERIQKLPDSDDKVRQASELEKRLARARGEKFTKNKKIRDLKNDPEFQEAYDTYKDADGRDIIRRKDKESGYPLLRFDENGNVFEGSSTSNRISKSGKLAKNLGGAQPDHQAHHLIPDAVVRDHPLAQAARSKGKPPYDLDDGSNGIFLPESPEARIGSSSNLPVHNGSHKQWNAHAGEKLDAMQALLVTKFGSLEKIPENVLIQAMESVENQLRKDIMKLDQLK